MKIQGIRPTAGRASGVSRKRDESDSFRTLLESRLEKIRAAHPVAGDRAEEENRNDAWRAMEEAAALLDTALEQIRERGAPDRETVTSIEALRHRFGGRDEEACAIIATEARRLSDW